MYMYLYIYVYVYIYIDICISNLLMFKSKDDEIPQFTSLKLRLELEGPFALSFLAGTPCLNRNFQIQHSGGTCLTMSCSPSE